MFSASIRILQVEINANNAILAKVVILKKLVKAMFLKIGNVMYMHIFLLYLKH